MSKKDKRLSLDDAVEYLTAHPEQIPVAWDCPFSHKAGLLFEHIAPTEKAKSRNFDCGCPTMIKHSGCVAVDDKGEEDSTLTAKIERYQLPINGETIKVKDLPKFAKIQKMADDYYKQRGWR